MNTRGTNNLPYHTALNHSNLTDDLPVDRVEVGGNIALRYNIFDPIPKEYEKCDAMFCEPPWRHGFNVFNERVGFAGPTWVDFMNRINTIISETKVPVVITAGKAALRYLEGYTAIYPTSLNGANAFLVAWNVTIEDTSSAEAATQEICERFNVIGDWCCGYGRTAHYAKEAGKRFVVSDYNAQCIGYIANRIMEKH